MHDPRSSQFELWSSVSLRAFARWYDERAASTLSTLAVTSATTAAVGFASQYDAPTLDVYARCGVLGFSLYAISRCFWAGAWGLPAFETKKAVRIYAVVAVTGFGAFATVSTIGSLGATGGGISQEIELSDRTDALANAGQAFALYGGQMTVVHAAVTERADQAKGAADAEIAGNGPTGVPGPGSVSNAFLASSGKYDKAADLLETSISKGEGHIARLNQIIAEMREVQVDPDLLRAERSAKLKALSSTAIGEMRALFALDPARSIVAAADLIATGVPEPSRAPASSRARIAEIRADMTAYAASLRREAEAIAELAPDIPVLVTLSPAQRLIASMWRMPGLTMAAILLDLCGWIAVGFRLAIYAALRAKLKDEEGDDGPQYMLVDDLRRVRGFLEEADETRRQIEDLRPTPKRGRPPAPKSKKDEGDEA